MKSHVWKKENHRSYDKGQLMGRGCEGRIGKTKPHSGELKERGSRRKRNQSEADRKLQGFNEKGRMEEEVRLL